MSEATVRPSFRRSIRSALAARSGSWVTINTEIGRSGSCQGAKEVQDLIPSMDIEVPGRFVGEEQWTVPCDGSCDRHTLLLTTRELVGKVVGTVREIHGFERLHGALLRVTTGHA